MCVWGGGGGGGEGGVTNRVVSLHLIILSTVSVWSLMTL